MSDRSVRSARRAMCHESAHRPNSRGIHPLTSRTMAQYGERKDREGASTMTMTTTDRKPAAEHVAVRCVDSDVHPTPRSGELVQYIPEPWRSKYFSHPPGRRPDLLRRARLRALVRDAGRHLPGRRRVRRQRPRSGLQAVDHGGRRRHRDPRTRRLSGPAGRGRPRDELRAQRLAGQSLARRPQQLARALARFDLRVDRGARARRRRDREVGRTPLHGADPDQGRAPTILGRSRCTTRSGPPPPNTTSP